MNERQQYRQTIINAWQKHQAKQPLSDLESQIVVIILNHPEYQPILNQADLEKDYRTDNNPYLHISLHLSLHEQLQTNRPNGITEIYKKLLEKHQDPHHVEHLMINVMAELLWNAQQSNTLSSDDIYLQQLNSLL